MCALYFLSDQRWNTENQQHIPVPVWGVPVQCYKCCGIFNLHYRAESWYVWFLRISTINARQKILKRLHSLLFNRGEWWSGCWCSDWRVARVCPDPPGRVVHRSHCEETQVQSSQSVRGPRDEVRCLRFFILLLFVIPNPKCVTSTLSVSTRRSSAKDQEASDSVPVATTAGSLHAEGDEPQA